jgi:hypothetical protein
MVALNFNSSCKEAEPYYYDFLNKEGHGQVPETIATHIKHCQDCQEQLIHLTSALTIAESHIETEQVQAHSDTTRILTYHLTYINKPVSCEDVKPFLPGLSDPELVTRVPTPITVHIDNCQKCSEDLEAIRELNLNRKQLRRLSRLFTDKPAENDADCTEAQKAIPSLVSIVLSGVDSKILRHLCICPECRGLLYQRRETVLRGLPKKDLAEKAFPCEKVSARDFFDYAIPYGFDPATDQYAKFRQSLTSHLRTCPACLAKMQELHETIYGIYERADSDVVTIYHIDETAKTRLVEQPDSPYAGFPISVEVSKQEEAEVEAESLSPAIDFRAALRQKPSRISLRTLIKPAAVAAAIILAATVLFHNVPTAKAVTLGKIYEAVEKIKNIHITSFTPPNKEPTQELWISKTSKIYASKTTKQCVLWDIGNKTKKTKQPGDSITNTARLTDDDITGIEENISGVSGLIPFGNISDVPQGAEWNRVDDKSIVASKGIEVYDLTWPKRASDGSVVFWKWRVFADSETSLPQKVEWYHKSAADSEYILSSTTEVEYLSEGEIQKAIKEASF